MLQQFSDTHNAALHHSLIPNWTSPAFGKFVDACRSVVDELANAQTSGNGREEMTRCEGTWKQVLWLWERTWPEVDGMGEEDESASVDRFSGGMRARGSTDVAAEGATSDRDADTADDDVVEITRRGSAMGGSPYVSPYGGSGSQAVESANHG